MPENTAASTRWDRDVLAHVGALIEQLAQLGQELADHFGTCPAPTDADRQRLAHVAGWGSLAVADWSGLLECGLDDVETGDLTVTVEAIGIDVARNEWSRGSAEIQAARRPAVGADDKRTEGSQVYVCTSIGCAAPSIEVTTSTRGTPTSTTSTALGITTTGPAPRPPRPGPA